MDKEGPKCFKFQAFCQNISSWLEILKKVNRISTLILFFNLEV